MFNNFFENGNLNNYIFYLQPKNSVDKALIEKWDWLAIYFRTLSNVLLGLFKYENLDRVQKRRLQLSYFNSMYVCAFKYDDILTFAPCIPQGNINAWGEYSMYNAVLPNGVEKQLNLDECVIGSNLTLPTICDASLVYKFCELLAEIKLSIVNNTILSRKSAVIEVENTNGVNDAMQEFNNHTIGSPVIIKKQRTNSDSHVLSFTNITDTTEFYNNFRDIINDFLVTTGLNSLINPNKKERLVVSETETTDDIKNTLLLNRVTNRKQFIEDVNAMFGTNIVCDINLDVVNDVNNLKSMYDERSDLNVDN